MDAGALHAERALQRARAWLMPQARAGFPDCVHEMNFPRWAGFSAGPERQSSDLFARAVLAGLLLDIADDALGDPAWQDELRRLARAEADRLAAARLPDRTGGWGYFPALPELPPDLDSLAGAIGLFARIATMHLPLCTAAIDLALSARCADGSLHTWLIGVDDPPAARALMRFGVDRFWGDTVDVEVCARFHAALALAEPTLHRSAIEDGIRHLLQAQRDDGTWPCTWYCSPLVATEFALSLLDRRPAGAGARRRALRHLIDQQHAEGGWGPIDDPGVDTALAVALLARADPTESPDAAHAVARGVAWLCDRQTLRGTWKPAPWIRMEVGRAQGQAGYVATFGCESLSTALGLRALVRAAARRREASQGTPLVGPSSARWGSESG